MITINPTRIAQALAHAYSGTCRPEPVTAVRWGPCPACGHHPGPQFHICQTCGGARRIAFMESR